MESTKIQASLTIAEAQSKLLEIIRQVIDDDKEVTLLENGKKVAVIISINTWKNLKSNKNIEAKIEEENLIKSAEIYAQVFQEDRELQELTELALGE